MALKLILPLILGVILGYYLNLEIGIEWVWGLWLLMFVLAVSFSNTKLSFRLFFGSLSLLFFFVLGVMLIAINKSENNRHYFADLSGANKNFYQLRLIDAPVLKTNAIQCYVSVEKVNDERCYGEAIVYLAKNNKAHGLRYGDVIATYNSFDKIASNKNPNTFDYGAYLALQNIYHQGYLNENTWRKIGNDGNVLYDSLLTVQARFKNELISHGLNGKNYEVASALLLGDKTGLEFETRNSFAIAGAMHVLAVSGLHVGIVMLIVSFLFRPIKKTRNGKWIYAILVVLVIWFYALLTGMSPSVMRSALMFSFVVIGKEFERSTSVYQSIIISAFILILIDPFVIFHVGFQLSYLAVFGIVYLQPKIYNLWYTDYWLVDKIWQITSVSIAAQLATFPLGLYYFHQFPNYFLIANLIVIPLAFVILFVGILFFAFSWIPIINSFFYYLLDLALSILNNAVNWIEGLPFAALKGVNFPFYWLVGAYVIILLFIFAFVRKQKRILFAGLAMSIGLLLYQVVQKNELDARNTLIVYSLKKAVGLDIFHGTENFFVVNQSLMDDQGEIDYQIRPNWIYKRNTDQPAKTVLLEDHYPVLYFGHQKLFYLDSEMIDRVLEEGFPNTDIVYLNDFKFIPNEILERIEANKSDVILGNQIAYGSKHYIVSKLKSNAIHDLKNDGAFQLDFE